MDPCQLKLHVGAEISVPADRHEHRAAGAFAHGVGLPPEKRERQAEEHPPLSILGGGTHLLLER